MQPLRCLVQPFACDGGVEHTGANEAQTEPKKRKALVGLGVGHNCSVSKARCSAEGDFCARWGGELAIPLHLQPCRTGLLRDRLRSRVNKVKFLTGITDAQLLMARCHQDRAVVYKVAAWSP